MVYLNYITSKQGLLKLGTLVTGVITLGISCHSHFSSAWSTNYSQIKNETCQILKCIEEECPDIPDIGMEKYFIGIVIALFVFSAAHLLQLILFKEMTEHVFRIFDIGYHILGGILLIIGGALYIYSTTKVQQIEDLINQAQATMPESEPIKLQNYGEKIISGVGGLLNGLLYIGAGVTTFISKDISREKD